MSSNPLGARHHINLLAKISNFTKYTLDKAVEPWYFNTLVLAILQSGFQAGNNVTTQLRRYFMIAGKKRNMYFALGFLILTSSHGLLALTLTWNQAEMPSRHNTAATPQPTVNTLAPNDADMVEAQAKQLEEAAQLLRHYAREIRTGQCLIPNADRSGLNPTWHDGIHDI